MRENSPPQSRRLINDACLLPLLPKLHECTHQKASCLLIPELLRTLLDWLLITSILPPSLKKKHSFWNYYWGWLSVYGQITRNKRKLANITGSLSLSGPFSHPTKKKKKNVSRVFLKFIFWNSRKQKAPVLSSMWPWANYLPSVSLGFHIPKHEHDVKYKGKKSKTTKKKHKGQLSL